RVDDAPRPLRARPPGDRHPAAARGIRWSGGIAHRRLRSCAAATYNALVTAPSPAPSPDPSPDPSARRGPIQRPILFVVMTLLTLLLLRLLWGGAAGHRLRRELILARPDPLTPAELYGRDDQYDSPRNAVPL